MVPENEECKGLNVPLGRNRPFVFAPLKIFRAIPVFAFTFTSERETLLFHLLSLPLNDPTTRATARSLDSPSESELIDGRIGRTDD